MARVALVTGQSRGLGKALAQGFSEAGYSVVPCTRAELDVSDARSIRTFMESVPVPYVLVNNAGVLGPVGCLEDDDPEAWRRVMETNLFGPMHLMQAVLPGMREAGRGCIINIAGGGATDPLPGRSAYACSKAALVRLTETVAAELDYSGVRVNAVLPGPLPTDMLREIAAGGIPGHDSADPEAIPRAVRLCLYLASVNCRLTGRTISARFDKWPFDAETEERIMRGNAYTLRRIDGNQAP